MMNKMIQTNQMMMSMKTTMIMITMMKTKMTSLKIASVARIFVKSAAPALTMNKRSVI